MSPLTLLLRSALLFVIFGFLACTSREPLDLVIYNGVIYTVNESQAQVKAVGVTDGKITYMGAFEDIEHRIDENTKVLNLEGKTMTPGWIEGHGHFMGMGYNKVQLDLRAVTSYQELVTKVAAAAEQTKPGEWIVGRGWHQSKWSEQPDTLIKGFQTHHLLSSISPDNPVYLSHASGHAGFANAMAMEIAGVSNLQIEEGPIALAEGGEIIRDPFGNPTGIFNERAMTLITKHIPNTTTEKDLQALKLAVAECLKHGITGFHDAGIDQSTIDLYKANIENGNIKVRLWGMLSGRDTTLLNHWYEKGPEIGFGNHFLTIRSIKMYMDGALGSRGAWLLDEYTDRAGHYGHETTPIETLSTLATEALAHGFQVCAHAIGDRANREVLNQYELAFDANPEAAADSRFRIEHAQHIDPEDLPRFAELGVIAAMQGIHMASDRPWAIDRLGKQRIVEGAYVWQKLLETGAVVVNGSDVPVEPLNPLASFYASVSRQTLEGTPEGGYEPGQSMTREQALRSYTLDAAFSAFEEELKGSIALGKFADFTIFSQNIMEIPPAALLKTKVTHTIVGGKVYPQD